MHVENLIDEGLGHPASALPYRVGRALASLDKLINDGNRSYFLNELDGFPANDGIFTIATTNHPERLDPALLERPSRFDRKYYFGLPGCAERRAFLALWNGSVEPEMRMSDAGLDRIVVLTEGFSFAYLKEFCVSAMVRWMATAIPGAMDAVASEQASFQREQIRCLPEMVSEEYEIDEDA